MTATPDAFKDIVPPLLQYRTFRAKRASSPNPLFGKHCQIFGAVRSEIRREADRGLHGERQRLL
jgi:hypothetical protein